MASLQREVPGPGDGEEDSKHPEEDDRTDGPTLDDIIDSYAQP